MAKKNRISVVVPAHYRPVLLAKTLKALLQQQYPKEAYEILVVGCSKDKSLNAVENEFSGSGVRFFRIESTFVDKKRNFGIKNSKNEIIAFTDDDCLPEKNWLQAISNAFEKNPNIAGVEGLTWNDSKKLYSHAPENQTGNRFLACNYAFKKQVLEAAEGFDESYHLNYREDTDLAFKILKKGHRIVFARNAKVYHPPIKQVLNAPLKELKGVRSDVLLFKKFPDLYRERFGFICRGLFKLSGFGWLAAAFTALTLYLGFYLFALLGLISIFLVKIFVEKKGRQGTAFEWLAFVFFSYIRDMLFPFALAHYWVATRVSVERE